MTSEEQDALVGRVMRESKAAEEELRRLLVKFEHHAADIHKFADDMTQRVNRAKYAGENVDWKGVPRPGMPTGIVAPDGGMQHLQNYASVLDLSAIGAIDQEIGNAVARVLVLRGQRKTLGV